MTVGCTAPEMEGNRVKRVSDGKRSERAYVNRWRRQQLQLQPKNFCSWCRKLAAIFTVRLLQVPQSTRLAGVRGRKADRGRQRRSSQTAGGQLWVTNSQKFKLLRSAAIWKVNVGDNSAAADVDVDANTAAVASVASSWESERESGARRTKVKQKLNKMQTVWESRLSSSP